MPSSSVSSPIESELGRIRELSKSRRYGEALAAAEALAVAAPDNRHATYLIAANQRCTNRIHEALATLARLQQQEPGFSLLYQERGHCYMTLRDAPRAIEAFQRAVSLNPALGTSWSMLVRLYRMSGNHVEALRLLARIGLDRQKYPQALGATEVLLTLEPGTVETLSLHAAACVGLGRHQRAIEVYRQLIVKVPEDAELRVALGHCLKSVGLRHEAIESYRTAASLRPGFGDAYWSLANLKTFRFSADEISRMRAEESAPRVDAVDRCHLCFALGRAYEDLNSYAESWEFYERGNRLARARSRYLPEMTERNIREQIEVCTAELFAAHAGVGAPDPDPILIVGLPRSGSTLVEQILASHSQVEGTQELFDIQRMVHELQARSGSNPEEPRYPRILAALEPADFRSLGERYIADTRAYRGGKPFFIDKMPNNFRHIGLIHLMLPNARIIDVRREPMACCFSNLKQLFASGQEFTYSIEDIGRYYRAYLDLMRHWDAVLPGRVLRIQYEDVVEDLEANVRRILDFCGLAFEPACVEFHKTDRSIRTASSQQVRQPIFRDGLSQWRNYQPWLGPLEDALGDARIRYR